MVDWAVKANEEKTDYARTVRLCHRQIFARSLHSRAGGKLPLVDQVAVGDTIHLFFAEKSTGKVRCPGTFEVVTPSGHPYETSFGALVAGTGALYLVNDPTFIYEVDKDHILEPDPVLGLLTGWCIRRISGATLQYRTSLFGFRQTLARVTP